MLRHRALTCWRKPAALLPCLACFSPSRGGIAVLGALALAGCGGGSEPTPEEVEIAQRLQGDAAAVLGRRPLETECNGDGPFTCEMRLGPDRAPKYRVELCGERYDARVWPPPTDPAPREIAHLGADCRAGADLAQRKAAVAGLSIDDPAACEKTWAADAAEECRAYVAAGSRLAATEILYVRPLLDGTTEVLVDDRDAKAAVLIEEQSGRYVIAGVD